MAYINVNASPSTDEVASETVKPGCPMLIRSAASHPVREGAILMRCALGWSLHDELDYARCAGITAVQDCWQVHPERTPAVALPGAADLPEPAPAQHAAD